MNGSRLRGAFYDDAVRRRSAAAARNAWARRRLLIAALLDILGDDDYRQRYTASCGFKRGSLAHFYY